LSDDYRVITIDLYVLIDNRKLKEKKQMLLKT